MAETIERVPWTLGTRRGYLANRDPEVHLDHLEGVEWEWQGVSKTVVFVAEEVATEPEPVEVPSPEPELVKVPSAPRVTAEREAAKVPKAEISHGKAWPKLLYAEALAKGRPDLTDTEHRLLMAMWLYADNHALDGIYPGHTALSEQVGLSGKSGRDKVRTRINSLIRKGYVIKVREGRSIPAKVAAEYRLTLPEWEE